MELRFTEKIEASRHILPPALLKNLTKMVFAVLGREDEYTPEGVAFFVGIDLANLLNAKPILTRVVDSNWADDWATLKLVNSNGHEIKAFDVVENAEDVENEQCVLITMNIAFGGAVDNPFKISKRQTSFNVLPKTVTYDVHAAKGDSGGALVVGVSGKAVAMHVLFENKTRRLEQLDQELRDEVGSGFSNGISYGVRLDKLRELKKI